MKFNIRFLFLVWFVFLLFTPSSIIPGQEENVTNPDEPWHIITDLETIFIGESFWVNVTGPDNSSFTMRFQSQSNLNNTFERIYTTNERGFYGREFPSFRQGQEGFYSIQLIVDGIIQETRVIEIIYDEDQAQWIAIWDSEEWDTIQDQEIADQDKKMDSLKKHYEKWIKFFFIPAFCGLIFVIGIIVVSIWPAIRLWWIKDKKEISDSKRGRWTYEFVTGGKTSEDFREEFPGLMRDDEGAVFEQGDPRVTEDCYGKTEEELEKSRRESHHGKDWEEKHPYGYVPDEAYEMPEPWSRSFWLVLISSAIGLIVLLCCIWAFWYIFLPVGLGLLIFALIVYLKKVRKEEQTFEFENAEEKQ